MKGLKPATERFSPANETRDLEAPGNRIDAFGSPLEIQSAIEMLGITYERPEAAMERL